MFGKRCRTVLIHSPIVRLATKSELEGDFPLDKEERIWSHIQGRRATKGGSNFDWFSRA